MTNCLLKLTAARGFACHSRVFLPVFILLLFIYFSPLISAVRALDISHHVSFKHMQYAMYYRILSCP